MIPALVLAVALEAADRIAPPPSQTPSGDYDFTAPIGPHHRRVETTLKVRNDKGELVDKISRYIELNPGMHFFENGKWTPTEEKILPHPKGAAAENGFYQVIFGKNLNQTGAIEMIFPDGQRQKNHPIGLYLFDRSSGDWVLVGAIKDSVGQILPPNRVIYRDAFEDIRADVIYTYQKGQFEADVVLRERPASPESWGLNPDTTVLEMVSEFPVGPNPKISKRLLKEERDATKRGSMQQPELSDDGIDFGAIQMIQGNAFQMQRGNRKPADKEFKVEVGKRWKLDNGRQLLCEQVDWPAIAQLTADLNPAPSNTRTKRLGGKRSWPQARAPVSQSPMEPGVLADEPGMVLDYISNVSSGTVVFNSYTGYSTTYLVVNTVTLTSPVVIMGGAVIKYDRNASLIFASTVTGPTTTAYFTAIDDHTVGDQIG